MKSKSFHKPEEQETTTGKNWGRWLRAPYVRVEYCCLCCCYTCVCTLAIQCKFNFCLLALSCWGKLLPSGSVTSTGDDTGSTSMPLLTSISSQLLSQSEYSYPIPIHPYVIITISLIPILQVSFPVSFLSHQSHSQSHSYPISLIPSLISIPSVSFPCHQYNFCTTQSYSHVNGPSLTLLCSLLCQVFCCHTRVCGHSTVQEHYPGESCLFQKVRNSPSSLPPIDLAA